MQKNAQNERYLTFFTLKKIFSQKGQTPKGQLWVRFPQGVPKKSTSLDKKLVDFYSSSETCRVSTAWRVCRAMGTRRFRLF